MEELVYFFTVFNFWLIKFWQAKFFLQYSRFLDIFGSDARNIAISFNHSNKHNNSKIHCRIRDQFFFILKSSMFLGFLWFVKYAGMLKILLSFFVVSYFYHQVAVVGDCRHRCCGNIYPTHYSLTKRSLSELSLKVNLFQNGKIN